MVSDRYIFDLSTDTSFIGVMWFFTGEQGRGMRRGSFRVQYHVYIMYMRVMTQLCSSRQMNFFSLFTHLENQVPVFVTSTFETSQ